jgi:hypothetical protein
MKSGYFFFFFPPLFSIKNAIAGTSKFRNSSCLSRLAVGERPQGYFPVVFVLSKAGHIPTKLVSQSRTLLKWGKKSSISCQVCFGGLFYLSFQKLNNCLP